MYKILIADDDEGVRYAYSKMKVWDEFGFEIAAQFSNGKDALKACCEDKYDLILTDIRMPLLDGIAFLRSLRKKNIYSDVIFVSTYNDFEYARQGLILGAFDYILKPVKAEKLRSVLARAKEKLDEEKYSRMTDKCVRAAFDICGIKRDTSFAEQLYDCLLQAGNKVITMEEVAEHFEITKDYFGKLFKKYYGIPYNHFYSVLKIEYAKVMLREYNYKAYEISDILGFSSRDYFTRIFREVTGKTPSEYKTNHSDS